MRVAGTITAAWLVLCSGLIQANGAAAQDALVTFRVLAPETALKLAQATLAACRKQGYQVAVAVVDRGGVLQVMLRDRFAGPHTPDTARRKAWTANSFRTNTSEMAKLAKPGTPFFGVHHVTGALLVGGGIVIEAAGSGVGAIGVSGAPSGDLDEACAKTGLKSIEEVLNF